MLPAELRDQRRECGLAGIVQLPRNNKSSDCAAVRSTVASSWRTGSSLGTAAVTHADTRTSTLAKISRSHGVPKPSVLFCVLGLAEREDRKCPPTAPQRISRADGLEQIGAIFRPVTKEHSRAGRVPSRKARSDACERRITDSITKATIRRDKNCKLAHAKCIRVG